jgi:DNA-binding LytR/AlgR family response regulator
MDRKVVIIEDESLAADRMEALLKEINPAARVVARLPGIKESVQWLQNNKADLIFLDIQLSDGLSFSIFEEVETDAPVIFTTAYDQYAIQAFKLNSVDYLLKPVRREDLQNALKKLERLSGIVQPDYRSLIEAIQGKQPSFRKRFLIQYGDRIRKVECDEIAYFYVLDKGNYLKTFQNQSYPIDFTLDSLEGQLDPARFFRINRKIIVNMDAIKSMLAWSRSRIKLELQPAAAECEEVVVSIDRTPGFREWLNQ